MDLLFELLRVITGLFLFLVFSVYADHSPALLSPSICFGQRLASICVLPLEYPLEAAYYSDRSCGYPGLEVHCTNQSVERPFINISNHMYLVVDINYRSKQIRLVDIDVEGSGCPQPKRNFSFPSSPSWVNYLVSSRYTITIFYNCSSVPVDAEQHILCSKEEYKSTNTSPSYAFYEFESTKGFDWYRNCAQNVVVPIQFLSGDYSAVFKGGFAMRWSATAWCEDCERSGGHCWSNARATGCSCRNRESYNTACPPPTPPPPPPTRHQGV